MWAIDRERPIFDQLVNLLDAKHPLPAVTHSTYAEIVARHMDLLTFRCLPSNASRVPLGQAHCSSRAVTLLHRQGRPDQSELAARASVGLAAG